MDKPVLSAIVLTKNEGKNIKRCLDSLSFCDEIIVVDDKSEDKTVEIATQNGATLFFHDLNDDFASQRNFALEKAKGEWVLFVDADEVVTPELAEELDDRTLHEGTLSDYYIKRKDFFWNKELRYGEVEKWRNRGAVRLIKRGSGRWIGKVHEEFKPDKNSKIGSLNGFILHFPHQTVDDFIKSVNRYSSIRARELHEQGKKFNIVTTLAYPFGKFLYVYFFNRGFMDGPPGFAYTFFMSFHSFLSRAKLIDYD